MQLRFSIGNILGVVTTAAGYIVAHTDAITALTPYGKTFVAVGTVVLALTKGLVTHNADQIPEAKKVQVGPVVFEKTMGLQPDTPTE